MTDLTNNSDNSLKFKLIRSENKFLTMFQLSPVGMAIVDGETGDFLEVNNALLKSTGYTKKEFLQLSYWDITPKKYEEQELQQLKDLENSGHFGPNQKEYIRKDGTKYPISISGVALTNTDGRKIVLGIIEDISERKAYEEKLKHFALYDPLTDLPNRRLLSENMQQSIAQCKREKKLLAILLLDINKFKPINDEFGHTTGDKLLTKIAQRIKRSVQRKTDTVARIGGDEFVIMLPLIKKAQHAIQIANKICHAIEEPFIIDSNTLSISASIGISIFPEHGHDENSLLAKADSAMYQIKSESTVNSKIFEAE